MRTLIFASCLISLLAGCKDAPPPPTKTKTKLEQLGVTSEDVVHAEPLPTGVRIEIANAHGRSCHRTLCVAGPGQLEGPDSPGNHDLGLLCARAPGVVQRCEGERCQSVWAVDGWEAGFEAMVASLDSNGDGKVDAADPSCALNLAGWSTGAVVVSQAVPRALLADPRVDQAHAQIQHLLAITPYRAPAAGQDASAPLEIASNVGKAFIYRHTKSPADDCSAAFEGGPWLSPAPVCGEQTTCFDYDYSRDPELAYLGRRGARSGPEVGHCDVVSMVAKIGLDNLARGQEAFKEMLPPYSDGTHGGRVVEARPLVPDPVFVLPNENDVD